MAYEVCACENIDANTWERMGNTFKYNAYCKDCGFKCNAMVLVEELRWCEQYNIDVSQLE